MKAIAEQKQQNPPLAVHKAILLPHTQPPKLSIPLTVRSNLLPRNNRAMKPIRALKRPQLLQTRNTALIVRHLIKSQDLKKVQNVPRWKAKANDTSQISNDTLILKTMRDMSYTKLNDMIKQRDSREAWIFLRDTKTCSLS